MRLNTGQRSARRAAIELLAALAAVTAAVVVLVRVLRVVSPTIVALALLLVVLGVATVSRLWVAIVTSIAAMLSFNFFFLPPVGTFTIADAQNWIALFAFLVVAVIASQLSSIAQARARGANARRLEVGRLFDLSRDMLLTTETDEALPVLARLVSRRFELDSLAICMPGDAGWSIHQGGERDVTVSADQLDQTFVRLRGVLEYDARRRAYGGHVRIVTADGRPVTLVPLRIGTRPVGLLATEAVALDVGVLDALGGVVAIAIERAHFLRERESAEALRQRADLAAALLASLSHDLRTPLTAIRIAIGNLQERDIPEADRASQAKLALAEVDRLNRLFQDILDMARIDAAAIAAEPEWVAPADLVDAAIARGGALLAARALHVDADADTEAEVDPRLTSNALAHLIENAAQYSPPDRPIEIRGWTSHEGVHLTVRDAGPGLDRAELDHLFERFFRGSSARQHSFGTGMGLAITRGLLAAEGGRVWGENAEGGGARFSIVVPAAVRAVAQGTA